MHELVVPKSMPIILLESAMVFKPLCLLNARSTRANYWSSLLVYYDTTLKTNFPKHNQPAFVFLQNDCSR